jgi:hypothetical protein
MNDVTALKGMLKSGVFEVRKVLAGKTEDRRGLLAGDGAVIGS